MQRATALTKLKKLLGPSMGYRIDHKAPSAEEREAARAALPGASEAKADTLKKMEQRKHYLLAGDAEYQRLSTEAAAARKHFESVVGTVTRHKITVGTTGAVFFSVRAEGDSWEDVIAKLTKKGPPTRAAQV